MAEQKNDIRILGFANYNRPVIRENTNRGWVTNGVNNKYFQYVIDRNQGSPTNASVNSSYSNLMYGKGLWSHDADAEKQVEEFNSKFSKKDQRKVLNDFQIFGMFAFSINREGGDADSIAEYAHLPINKVVPSVKDEDGNILSY